MIETTVCRSLESRLGLRALAGAPLLAVALALTLFAAPVARAQTFRVLHAFTGYPDGGQPSNLTVDSAGNLYGPAACCGSIYGTIYEMQRFGSDWAFDLLYTFHGDDGRGPDAVAFGPDGVLYGTTHNGGQNNLDNGTVFSLEPASATCRTFICLWTGSLLYSFGDPPDAGGPMGNLTFDQAGDIYGTAATGPDGAGSVYELTRSGSGWSEKVIYGFQDEQYTYSGVIFDGAGNLYGTTTLGSGIVFQLVPTNGSWRENVLYYLRGNDGSTPLAGLIFDRGGSLYGTTSAGGVGNGGTVFRLSPLSGGWTFTTIYSFAGKPSCGPAADLVMDAAGSLYGTTMCDGAHGHGSAFRLTPSGGSWTFTSLHDFCEGGPPCSDGYSPSGRLALDSAGNVYGTSLLGGDYYNGVLWEITPQ